MQVVEIKMPRAKTPSSPADELAAYGAHRSIHSPAQILTDELAAFCESGLSVVVAACGADGRPIAGRARGCRVTGPDRMHIFLQRSANDALLAALDDKGRLAVTFTRPTDHRSIQLKGSVVRAGTCLADDGPWITRQCNALRDELIEVGYSPAFSTGYVGYVLHDLVALDLSIQDVFVQTPGPGAGSALRP